MNHNHPSNNHHHSHLTRLHSTGHRIVCATLLGNGNAKSAWGLQRQLHDGMPSTFKQATRQSGSDRPHGLTGLSKAFQGYGWQTWQPRAWAWRMLLCPVAVGSLVRPLLHDYQDLLQLRRPRMWRAMICCCQPAAQIHSFLLMHGPSGIGRREPISCWSMVGREGIKACSSLYGAVRSEEHGMDHFVASSSLAGDPTVLHSGLREGTVLDDLDGSVTRATQMTPHANSLGFDWWWVVNDF